VNEKSRKREAGCGQGEIEKGGGRREVVEGNGC